MAWSQLSHHLHCHLFPRLAFFGNAAKPFTSRRVATAGCAGGWRSNTIPLKMVYRNLMNAQIPLISAGTHDTRKTGQEYINYIISILELYILLATILLLWSDKMLRC